MDPRALTRAARNDIRMMLGDPALRGERLADAIRGLGERRAIEPFRACLGLVAPIDRAEPEARRLILSIERHRSGLESRLGRDPGFGIAAIDYLHGVRGLIGDPVPSSRRGNDTGEPARRERAMMEPLQRALALNVRRCERIGRPLTLAVLRPDRVSSGRRGLPAATLAALLGAVRDIDHAGRILPEGFGFVLPCTPGQGGVITAERLRLMLTHAADASWSAGVASCPEHPWDPMRLVRRSQEAVARARAEGGNRTVWSHPERRAARRRTIGDGGLIASLAGGATRRAIAIDDLSMSGALVRADAGLARDQQVTLALSGTCARARRVALAARVVRAERTERGAESCWSIGLRFDDVEPARSRVAGLIADLPPDGRLAERRS